MVTELLINHREVDVSGDDGAGLEEGRPTSRLKRDS